MSSLRQGEGVPGTGIEPPTTATPSSAPASTSGAPAVPAADAATSDGGGDNVAFTEYSTAVAGRLKSLVAAPGDLGEDTIQEIRRLLTARRPESVCELEDEIAPIRANLWSVLLLGLRTEDVNR